MRTADLLSHQMVRDLLWLFSSPSLIQPNQLSFQQKPFDENWLRVTAESPEKISNFMADKNLKMLGPYFEALWEFYFVNCPGKKLIAKNVQVFAANKTIGEFDFIYLDEATGEYRHLEVAIKYFLGLNDKSNKNVEEIGEKKKAINSYSPMNQWLGPNANDRLDKKYFKMLEQQSQLSQTPEGIATLEVLGVSTSSKPVKSEICLLGYLFYPLDGEEGCDPMLPPENSHTSHNKGYWLKVSQLEMFLPEGHLWKIMDKPFWMAPLQETRQQLKTQQEILIIIKKYIFESQRPLLISNFIETDKNNGVDYESDKKYFVVFDNWPEKII